ARLEGAIRRNDALSFHYAPIERNAPPELRIRVVGDAELLLRRDTTVTVSLARLKGASSGGRVDFLVFDPPRTTEPATFAMTFQVPPHLPTTVRGNADTQVAVRLDRTGIATWAFLNPRWPVLLGPPTEDDAMIRTWQDEAYLIFNNQLSDRQFVVTFS